MCWQVEQPKQLKVTHLHLHHSVFEESHKTLSVSCIFPHSVFRMQEGIISFLIEQVRLR